MKRRYVLVGLAVVLALSMTLPAVGAPSVSRLAKKALRKANQADRRAKRAQQSAAKALAVAKVQGPVGAPGAPGAAGAPGTARAFAQVDDSGPVYVTPRTKNFTGSPRRSGTGIYCLRVDPTSGVDPRNVAAVAGAEWGNSVAAAFALVRGFNEGDCAADEFSVHTFDAAGAPSNLVAFTLVVP